MAIRPLAGRRDYYEDSQSYYDDYRLSSPGDPIYAPRRRRGTFLRALVFSIALVACGWGLLTTQASWVPWVTLQTKKALAAWEASRASTKPPAKPASRVVEDVAQKMPAGPLPTKEVADAPALSAGSAIAGSASGNRSAGVVEEGSSEGPQESNANDAGVANGAGTDAKVEPLPPIRVDQSDPYQKRALAAGLHPELSRVVLSKLSDKDFSNAQTAISKAIATVADNETLVWPQKRVPNLAVFKVHFVAGASPDCRRYVVVIAMDGWSTTAMPMEKCGVKAPSSRSSARATPPVAGKAPPRV